MTDHEPLPLVRRRLPFGEHADYVVWPSLILMAWMLLLGALLTGCGAAEPPSTISVQNFSKEQRTVVLDAVDAWCEAVGWCPTVARWSESGQIMQVDELDQASAAPCPEGLTCRVLGTNFGDSIGIEPIADLDTLWMVAAHEVGHWCSVHADRWVDDVGHTEFGIMAALQTEWRLNIDSYAIRAWRSGCR